MAIPTAKEIMNSNVITVVENMSLTEVADLFTQKMISGAPVVDAKGKLLGVVSLSDIVQSSTRDRASLRLENKKFYKSTWEDQLSPEDLQDLHLEIESSVRVKDIMTPVIICVSENTDVVHMADIMISGHIHRLLITQDGKTTGIVTTTDMLKVIRDFFPKQTLRDSTESDSKDVVL